MKLNNQTDKQEIGRLYKQGLTTREVAKSLGVSQRLIILRLIEAGVPRRPAKRRKTPTENFWTKVDKNGPVNRHDLGPCWIYKGGRDKDGYGQFSYRMASGTPTLNVRAHRFSYELEYGPLTDDKPFVCHHCDNPPCVRPTHLFAGTLWDNEDDKMRKGRQPSGEVHGMSKLTRNQVREIRGAYASGLYLQQDLAEIFKLSQVAISRVILNKSWRKTSVRLTILFCVLMCAGSLHSQTLGPILSEFSSKAGKTSRGSFKIQNDSLYPEAIIVEPMSSSFDHVGIHERVLDPTVHVKLNPASTRLGPKQIVQVDFEIQCDVEPCYVALRTAFSPVGVTQGIAVKFYLTHHVYINEGTKHPRFDALTTAGLTVKK